MVDPKALDELFPDWRSASSPLTVPVTDNHHWVLTEKGKRTFRLSLTCRRFMHNEGTYTGQPRQCHAAGWRARPRRWASRFSPVSPRPRYCSHDDGSVKGVATGDMGVARDGTHKPDYQPGMELHARYTFFAEGARGHLTKELTRIFDSARGQRSAGLSASASRNCGTFLPSKHQPGRVIHTAGLAAGRRLGRRLPLSPGANGQVALGFVVAPRLSEPLSLAVRGIPALEDPSGDPRRDRGRQARQPTARARSTRAAGRPIPKLAFPGGALIGCAAGFVNVPRIKGSHTAMKSGMLAAEAAFEAIAADRRGDELDELASRRCGKSWIADELKMRPQRAAGGGAVGRDDGHDLRRHRHVAQLR